MSAAESGGRMMEPAPATIPGSWGNRVWGAMKKKKEGNTTAPDTEKLISKVEEALGLMPIRPIPPPLRPYQTNDTRFDDFAIALKTGQDTSATRVSVQLITFLTHIKHKIVIGDSPNEYIGFHPVIDVYSGLYEHTARLLEEKERGKVNANMTNTTATLPSKARRSLPDVIANVDGTRGWELDAHKNLPGFQLLYAKYPNAKWFLMIDDDSYVFMDNLLDLVKGLNHEENHYMGNANVFTGCDGVNNFGDGPEFAHGGSGILMSRGALKAMVGGIEKCIIKYQDCWAGDIRTALCLRDHKILVKGTEGFSGDPPNKNYEFPNDPCKKPIVFHHLLPHQIQHLYTTDQTSHRHHPTHGTTYSDVFNHFFHTSGPLSDHDRPGKELEGSGKEVGSPEACEKMCREYSGVDAGGRKRLCWSWVLDGKKCWMKEGVEDAVFAKGLWTGSVARKYVCEKY
ncbi:hypothetical protein HDU67_002205 [Dinochytrium kinnereticum]|nr:hypothetical protein HDU67_002205 [Dinochytrium kinnereticum]